MNVSQSRLPLRLVQVHLCILPIQYSDAFALNFARTMSTAVQNGLESTKSLEAKLRVTAGHARGEKKQFSMQLRISEGRFRFDETDKGMGFLARFLQAHLFHAIVALPMHLAEVHKNEPEFLTMAGHALGHCYDSYTHGINPSTVDSVVEKSVQYAWARQSRG